MRHNICRPKAFHVRREDPPKRPPRYSIRGLSLREKNFLEIVLNAERGILTAGVSNAA